MSTAVRTSKSIHDKFGISSLEQEFPELEVPTLTDAQRQGDVMILPVTVKRTSGAQAIGRSGVIVVRAETNSANTHTLHALAGECLWMPNTRRSVTDLVEGWLTVTDGAEATLIHTEEHAALAIGPGTYEIRRQREFAGEWNYVAD